MICNKCKGQGVVKKITLVKTKAIIDKNGKVIKKASIAKVIGSKICSACDGYGNIPTILTKN